MRRARRRYRRGRPLARRRRLPGRRAGALARAPRRAGERAALALRSCTGAARPTPRWSARCCATGFAFACAGGGDPRAHYLHTVLERGAGVPIACSAIWIAVGARAEIPVEGVNLPGHFVVRVNGHLFDTVASGEPLDEEDVKRLVTTSTGRRDRRSRTGAGGAGERTRHARAHVAQPAPLLHQPRMLGPGAACGRPMRRPGAVAGRTPRSRAAPVAHGQGRGCPRPTSPRISTRLRRRVPIAPR